MYCDKFFYQNLYIESFIRRKTIAYKKPFYTNIIKFQQYESELFRLY
jgi:hypothetical protein